MVVSSNIVEIQVSAKRIWSAMVEDAHNVLPKCVPDKIAAVEYDTATVEAGTVRTIKFHEGPPLKEKFEELDKVNLKVKITCIEGGFLNVFFKEQKLSFHYKEGATPGTSIIEGTLEYEGISDQELPEEVKIGMLGAVKAVEAYLIANPSLYA